MGSWVQGDTSDVELGDAGKLMLIDKPKANWKSTVGLVLIAVLTVFGLANAELVEHKVACLMCWSKTLGPWAAVLMFALSAFMPVIMLPVFPLMALSGPLFTKMYDDWRMGGTVAFLAVFTGLWLGSVIAFSLGKTIFKGYAERASEKSMALKRINRLVDTGGIKIVLMARASPMMPAEVFDYACSITTLKIWQYAVGCLGSAVPVAFWTYSSAQAAAAHDAPSGGKVGLIVINVIALAALTALLVRMIGREEAALLAKSSPAVQTIRRASSSFPLSFRPFPASVRDQEPLQEQLLRPRARSLTWPSRVGGG